MNSDTLLSRLAPVTDEQAAAFVSPRALGELAEDIIRAGPGRPAAAPARRHASRRTWNRPRIALAAGAALATAAAVAAAVVVASGQPGGGAKTAERATSAARSTTPATAARPTPAASATLAAWTVTRSADGTLTVTVREMSKGNAAGLQATLRADGARVVVNASLMWPARCTEWRAGNYRMGGQVVQSQNRTGLPSAGGAEFRIKPSLIPAGALLWIGLAQSGNLRHVYGPPGPTAFGYLTASRACTGS